MSSHRLRCETGRWERPVVPYGNRMCIVCRDRIGDEFHVLLECLRHQAFRSRLTGRYYWNRPSMLKLQLLNSTSTKVIRAVAKFVHKAVNDLYFYIIHVCGFLYVLIPRCFSMLLCTPCWSLYIRCIFSRRTFIRTRRPKTTWRHQTITWTNVDLSSVRSSDILLIAISQKISQWSIIVIGLKSTHLKFHYNLPGHNELITYRGACGNRHCCASARNTTEVNLRVDWITGVKCPVNAGKYWSNI